MEVKVIYNRQAFRDEVLKQFKTIKEDVVDDLKRVIIRSFGAQKHGRFYRRPKIAGGGLYQASAKGEAPAIRSGKLFRSLHIRFPSMYTAELKIDTPYAAILEFQKDRPFARVAAKTVAQRFKAGSLGKFA